MRYSNLIKSLAAGLILLGVATGSQADFIDKWVNGFYYEGSTTPDPRRGLGVQYIPIGPEAGVLFVAYYAYDLEGNPFWVQGASPVYSGDFRAEIPLALVEGGSFGDANGTPSDTDPNWGTGTFTVNSCNDITWAWTSPNVDDGSNTMNSVNQVTNIYPAGQPSSQCVYQEAFAGCPEWATEVAERVCLVSGDEYTEDLHFTNNTLWYLEGAVFIGEKDNPDNTNALYIEPGTRIVSADENTLLSISRGAKIFAEGVAHAPIVMTGLNTATLNPNVEGGAAGSSQDWGGFTINGKSYLNTCDTLGECTAQGEGSTGTFGGNDPHDSSGVIRFLRVQFSGFKFNDQDELNGIAFQGVGDGTVVENIQVHATADDGVEFFGGTVNVKNLVVTYAEDDSIDWTMGWNGKIQNALVMQDPSPDLADRGIEADNLEQNNDATPRALAEIANATFIGNPSSTAVTARRGTGLKLTNVVFTGFNKCYDLDSSSTFTNAGAPPFPGGLTGNVTIENSILDCDTVWDDEDGDPWLVSEFGQSQPNNMEMSALLNGVYPPEDAEWASGFDLDREKFSDYFNNFPHIGAFSMDPKESWTSGWTLPMPAYDK